MFICHHSIRTYNPHFLYSLWRRLNVRNSSFVISSRWKINPWGSIGRKFVYILQEYVFSLFNRSRKCLSVRGYSIIDISILVGRDCRSEQMWRHPSKILSLVIITWIDQSILSIGYKPWTFILFPGAGRNDDRQVFTLRRISLSFAP